MMRIFLLTILSLAVMLGIAVDHNKIFTSLNVNYFNFKKQKPFLSIIAGSIVSLVLIANKTNILKALQYHANLYTNITGSLKS